MSTYDISSQFLTIFSLIYDAVIYCWGFLDSIKVISNVSILDICIAVLLIGTFLPIIIGLAGRGVSASSGYSRRSRFNAMNEEKYRKRNAEIKASRDSYLAKLDKYKNSSR